MYKAIALLKAKPGLSRERFVAYYERHHVPLILRFMPQIKDYRRNYVQAHGAYLAAGVAELDFDAVTELWYASEADYRAAMAVLNDPAILKAIADDEAQFLDRDKTRMFVVEEHATESRL
ncbi:MAG: EthD domain-containing protein [Proteobacteria bacterium]|nr:EthD domain-containing protein [Pseudomonadota bacterium]